MEIPGLAESRSDGPRVGEVEEAVVYVGGWMDGLCLMDGQVSRQQHSLDSPTYTVLKHTHTHMPVPPCYLPSSAVELLSAIHPEVQF